LKDFDRKVAVVTGTANPKGIGIAIATRLAGLGCTLVLADLDAEGAQARAGELESGGHEAIAVGTDMGDRDSVRQLAAATYDHYGAADILILNHVAPTGGPGHNLLDPDPSSWELHARVNLLGVVYGIKSFVPRMIDSGRHSHVLATTSGAGTTGVMYGNGPYASTKAGLTTVMECLYGQLRDAGADVVPGLIFPGVTDTFPADGQGQLTVDMLKHFGATTVLSPSSEVADVTVDAIERDLFWANPDAETDRRLTGGRHSRQIAWENEVHRRRSAAFAERGAPDSYLWGPPSTLIAR
jgi:NAD(P)-dependent dehydrogenase (short-subunit alcohol dehydrogenase family)